MLVNPTSRTLTARTSSAASTTTTGSSVETPSFETQLSAALAESLQKLGVSGGEVNISVRNPTASTRQIVVTYSTTGTQGGTQGGENSTSTSTTTTPPPATATTAGSTGTRNPSASHTTPGNPFLLSLPYIAPAPVQEASETPWAPSSGPRDTRDQMPAGGGRTTASGAPQIVENQTLAGNQYGYAGPAAKNPYFSTPSNPLRQGYVLGFDRWFENPQIHGGPNGPQPANKTQYSTEEGAQEALRIVRQFAPEATITQTTWQSGPYGIDKPMYLIDLGGGRSLNAGGVLCAYYTHGYGVPASSDETIRRAIQLA